MLYALCPYAFLLPQGPEGRSSSSPEAQRSAPEVLMPAIASIEDLKSAQKEGVSICAMLYALCPMRDVE